MLCFIYYLFTEGQSLKWRHTQVKMTRQATSRGQVLPRISKFPKITMCRLFVLHRLIVVWHQSTERAIWKHKKLSALLCIALTVLNRGYLHLVTSCVFCDPEKTRSLIYKTLRRFHPTSVRRHKSSILRMHKSFTIYKSQTLPKIPL